MAKKSTKKTTRKAASQKASSSKSKAGTSKKTKSTKKTTKKAAASKSATTKKKTTKKKTSKKKTTAKKTAKKAPVKKSTTRKKTTTKKVVVKAAAPREASILPDKPLPKAKLKTPFSRKELTFYMKLLLEKRIEIVGDMSSMSTEALRLNESNLSTMPLHMADIGSDNFEQELTLGLVESERKLLHEIDEALERIASRTYGMCMATGKPIPEARLEVKPWAKYTIEAAREIERNGNGY